MLRKIKIGTREIRILMGLQAQPLATYQELAELTGYSKSYVYKTLQKLNQSIHPNNQNKVYYVVAHPKLSSLNLEMCEIFFHTNNTQHIKILEDICDFHPYTVYRARCFGKHNGLYCQFRIPHGSFSHLEELCTKLKSSNYVDSYQLLSFPSKSIYTATLLSHWDPEQLAWSFDWDQWFAPIITSINQKPPKLNSINKITKPTKNKEGSAIDWISSKDIAILAELCRDARRKEVDIIETLKNKKDQIDFTPQTFSRHIRRLKEECVDHFRVFIDPQIFDLFHTLVIYVKCNPIIIHHLKQRLEEEPIPFTSTFKHAEKEFFWYLQLPNQHLFALLARIQPLVQELNYYAIDKPTSKNYVPWYYTFDDVRQDWKKDVKFMVTDVLDQISVSNI